MVYCARNNSRKKSQYVYSWIKIIVACRTQPVLFSKVTPGEDDAPLAFDNIVEYASDIVTNEEFYKQYNISPREQEVLLLLLQGKSNNEIGETLYVSRNTIKTHIRNIYTKLGVNNRYELIYMLKQANQPPSSEQYRHED